MDHLSEIIKQEEKTCEENNAIETSKLKESLRALPKNLTLQQLRDFETNKKLLEGSIDESNLRKKVFLHYCGEIKAELEELKSSTLKESVDLPTCIELLNAKFEREYNRYEKGFPIYAHRLDIMRVIESKQVCIVIGETGSGKSTQLVQFLYEAGYATSGMIVCTQPRKLAAISLGEHVSREVKENVGETYGYVATKSKRYEKTKVVFMTDHSLLNECIADPNLSKYSCVVIDEAHERSIHTDILIALIKRCLPNREDLKVIITSATINPTLFSRYFGGKEACPVVEVPGRTYPVEMNWEESEVPIVTRKYVSEAVNKVHDIHIGNYNEPGDVLVFLTSPAEIEKACKLALEALKNEVVILPLHGKLQPEDQQKVFEPVDGKRKVVFSTNVAETSVTIPGIKYVIDTGLSKELCYDPQKNMNSLEIRPISKSSANQRKGRAGRTAPGECYRLYSQSDYDKMRDDSVPEILRITLAFAVIKLYEFGIKDIHSFEFVEAPDKNALDKAVENLKFLGAIKDGKLTDLGRRMALLPLDPSLSKILFDAIERGIGIEAAAAVAISTLAGRIFFRPSDDESKAESDRKRLPFCQLSGDQMTYLHTYFEWSRQERQDRNKWCVENYVNAKSMRMVQQIVDELRFILKQKCNIDMSSEIISLDNASEILPRLFFDAFLENICVHLGHSKVGYWCEQLPTEQLAIHNGSSLYYLSSIPQCVIYEKTQKTSRHFLLQALPVHEEWIQDAISKGQLQCHPAESSLFKIYQLHCLSFDKIGPSLSSKLAQKFPGSRRKSVPEFSYFNIQPVFEHSRQHGTLAVYCQEIYHNQVQGSVSNFIESTKKELKEESHEYGILSDNDDVRIIIGAGGSIQRLLMPGDFQKIIVRGLNDKSIPAATEELKAYGECSVERKPTCIVVKYQDSADALKALNHQFANPSIVIQQYKNQKKHQFCMKVEWSRRARRDHAFINFRDSNFFDRYFSPSFSQYRKGLIRDTMSELQFQAKNATHSIKVNGIRSDTTKEFIISRLLHLVPQAEETVFNQYAFIRFLHDAPFEESEDNLARQRNSFRASLAQYATQNKYYVNFIRPKDKEAVIYRAFVYCDDADTYIKAVKGLQEEGSKYMCELTLSSSVRYIPRMFSVIEASIQELCEDYSRSQMPVKIEYGRKDKWGNRLIEVSSSYISAFIEAKECLSRIVEPDVITVTKHEESIYLSTVHFMESVKKIQEKTTTYIKIDSSGSNSVTIYGTKKQRDVAKKEIEKDIKTLMQDGTHCYEIDLKRFRPGLMKELIFKYGANVVEISLTTKDIKAARLDPRKQILTLFTTEAAYRSFFEDLNKFNPNCEGVSRQATIHDATKENPVSECCVCFEAHDYERQIATFRLEYCGHVYCKECIKLQLQSTSVTFPITCAAEECEQELVWKDFENIGVKCLRDIIPASLKAYVAMNTATVHNCITPDCEMVYLYSESGQRFVCGQCGANICTHCHTTWHEGYTCSTYKDRDNRDAQLRAWITGDEANRKMCPKCDVPIEKNGGCSHIACSLCKSHICWKCLQYFSTSGECYNHIDFCTGIR